ncbi:DUF1471 family periplasmic protein YahO [Pantoea brenneri]|uniref:DUF1471 family periplasmic protein YahO n=1 Tax=Pantoea brenneri TaxID=472694 RepID=UPI00289822F0|nr:DUF1471 family periplasmic protein YahO [Pantoea brenneri]
MKKIIYVIAAGAFSLNVFAADMMTKNDFEKVQSQYEKVGSVSTSGEVSASDAKAELSSMADKKGGDIYVLTSGNTNNKMHATADVYKKK